MSLLLKVKMITRTQSSSLGGVGMGTSLQRNHGDPSGHWSSRFIRNLGSQWNLFWSLVGFSLLHY
jgi:hypothetical protein